MGMTPQEIADHKQRWMSSGKFYVVAIHSDNRWAATQWCKVQLHKQQWVHRKFTDVYEDTFFFEYKQDAVGFSSKFQLKE